MRDCEDQEFLGFVSLLLRCELLTHRSLTTPHQLNIAEPTKYNHQNHLKSAGLVNLRQKVDKHIVVLELQCLCEELIELLEGNVGRCLFRELLDVLLGELVESAAGVGLLHQVN